MEWGTLKKEHKNEQTVNKDVLWNLIKIEMVGVFHRNKKIKTVEHWYKRKENMRKKHFNMILKLALISSLLALAASRTHLTDCLDDHKYCVGLPRGCVGTECNFAFSSIVSF